MRPPAHRDPHIVGIAHTALRDLAIRCEPMVYAALITDDGFEVAHTSEGVTQGDRFASMSSSVQALSEAVTRELHLGSNRYVVIASDDGHVIQLRVPGVQLVLAAMFDARGTLGSTLSLMRSAVELIGLAVRSVHDADAGFAPSVQPGGMVTGPFGESLRPERASGMASVD